VLIAALALIPIFVIEAEAILAALTRLEAEVG
jgi:hypothetical protein